MASNEDTREAASAAFIDMTARFTQPWEIVVAACWLLLGASRSAGFSDQEAKDLLAAFITDNPNPSDLPGMRH